MKILKILGIALLGFSLIAGVFIYTTYASESNQQTIQSSSPYSYHIVKQSKNLVLDLGEPEFMKLIIQNNGRMEWPIDKLFLNSIFFDETLNYESPFATSNWINKINIKPSGAEGRDSIKSGSRVTFNIPIQSNVKSGLYKIYFKPIIDFGNQNATIITGDLIEWILIVGSKLHYQNMGEAKQILISLDDQKLIAIENYAVIMEIPISTGKRGYDTPTGWFKILNHVDTAYSSGYSLYMDNWMALSSLKYGFRGYGLHKLPYWKVNPARYLGQENTVTNGRFYTQGKLYEDYNHLGEKMSHGCIRLGLESSRVLYDWADNGTLVNIV